MAIVQMSKLSVIGLNDCQGQLLKEVMDLGVVEINNQENKLSDDQWKELVRKDGDDATVYQVDGKLSEVNNALEVLDKYYTGKKPLFNTRQPLSEKEFNSKLSDKASIEAKIQEVNEIYKEVTRLKNEEVQINTTIIALYPWKDYEVPLDLEETKSTSIVIGTMPASIPYEGLCDIVGEKSQLAEVYKVASDEKIYYVSLVCMKQDKEMLLDLLRSNGFSPISFGDVMGNASENILKLEKAYEDVKQSIIEEEEKLMVMGEYREQFKYVHDEYIITRDRAKVLSSLVKTDSIFYFDGWLPKAKEEEVKAVLESNKAYYEITEPVKGEETPILLKQNALSEPFEAITNLYSTPSINDVDPTPLLAPFYFIFFGLMLSDAGYGIILSVACFIILKKFRLEGMMKKLIKMFMYCGVSTVVWGALFGGWFGDFFPVAAKSVLNIDITLDPLWFNPVQDPMKLLILSLILGAIHLFTGMGIKAYMLIKNGQLVDAICDIFLWYALLIGLVLLGTGGSISPMAVTIGKVLSIGGAVLILFTGGRKSEKLLGKLTGGLGDLYGITGYLSDVLSYSRLLALGLATGVVAQVVNTLGALAGGGIKGAVVMTIAFIIGHTFNMAINILSAFVHSSRLQYVEFFGKFFDGGGRAFQPFNKKTKYVEIIKEEK